MLPLTLKQRSLHHEILHEQHRFYCGIDLHANAMYVCIIDSSGEVVVHKNIPTKPKSFLRMVKPYRDGLVVGCELVRRGQICFWLLSSNCLSLVISCRRRTSSNMRILIRSAALLTVL